MLSRLSRVAAAALVLAAAPVAARAQEPTPIVIGSSHQLESAALGDAREVNVWLPPAYADGAERYSVLYVLDGALDQDFEHIAGLGQLGALSWTYESLIVVGVQTRERRRELTPPSRDPDFAREFPEGGGADAFRRFLVGEVVPFVEARYRTGPRRALMGESLAGLFVVDTFLNTPSAFSDYIAASPSLWWDDKALARRAADLLAAHDEAERRLYLTIADEGGRTQAGMDLLVAALEADAPDGLTWRYVDRSASETHATVYHGAALDALRTLFPLPPYDQTGPTPWYYVEGGRPPETGGAR